MALYHERPKKPSCFAKRGGHARPPKGDTFVNGAEGCVRETRKGVLHEDDPHFSELFEALKNALSVSKKSFRHAEGHALRHGPGENAEEKGHLC
jgi:hypothetical protein